MTEPQRDRLLAVLAALFAVSVVAAARGIEDSLLSDAVGAGGVPQGVGLLMLAAALVLFAKSWRRDAATPAAGDVSTPGLRTAGLVLLLLGYGALLPWLGYPLAVTLLLAAVGALAGAPLRWPLALAAVLGGPLLWLLFDYLLQVRMPAGTLWGP